MDNDSIFQSPVVKNHNDDKKSEFTVIFKDEAYTKLKELGVFLGIPVEKLGDVIIKGLHLVDLAKYNGKVIVENNSGSFEVDVKKL